MPSTSPGGVNLTVSASLASCRFIIKDFSDVEVVTSVLPLVQVAFPSFRNSTERSASLVDYFDDARVTGWLAVHGEESDSPLAAFSALGRRLRSQLTQLIPSRVVRSTACSPHRSMASPSAAACNQWVRSRLLSPLASRSIALHKQCARCTFKGVSDGARRRSRCCGCRVCCRAPGQPGSGGAPGPWRRPRQRSALCAWRALACWAPSCAHVVRRKCRLIINSQPVMCILLARQWGPSRVGATLG